VRWKGYPTFSESGDLQGCVAELGTIDAPTISVQSGRACVRSCNRAHEEVANLVALVARVVNIDNVHTFCSHINIQSAINISYLEEVYNLPTISGAPSGFIFEGNEVVALVHLFVSFPTVSGHNNHRFSQTFLSNVFPRKEPIEFLFGSGSM
jgi:hypothetical protein